MLTLGLDVGSSAIKAALLRHTNPAEPAARDAEELALVCERIRRRDPAQVVEMVRTRALGDAGIDESALTYLATTGDADLIPGATGHFYSMTTHARGALFYRPEARVVIDVGALHARAIRVSELARVERYRMTSQCASGSGQFLENIARYLGVGIEEVGELSREAGEAETVSSICAVLAETDVINMVSRGIGAPQILRGIHASMAGRFARLATAVGIEGPVMVTGGLAADVGLLARIAEELDAVHQKNLRRATRSGGDPPPHPELISHPRSQYAGAVGAALWGAFRAERTGRSKGVA